MHCKLQFPVIRNKEHYAKGQSILNTTHKERGTIELLDPCCSTRCQSRMKTHLHDCCAEKERDRPSRAWQHDSKNGAEEKGREDAFFWQNSSHLPKRAEFVRSLVLSPTFSPLLSFLPCYQILN